LPAERIRDKCLVVFVLTSCEKIISKYKKGNCVFLIEEGINYDFQWRRGITILFFFAGDVFSNVAMKNPCASMKISGEATETHG